MTFVLAIFVSLALAFFLSEALKKIGIPRVIGQLTAGIILGIPLLKDFLFTPETLTAFKDLSDIAIILLFFFVGLELNLKSFNKNLKEGLLVSFFNTIIPFILGVIIAYFLNFDIIVGMVLGIAFAVSSQTVTFDLLGEFGLIKTRIGNLIIGAGAIDDILEFIFISIVLTFIQLETNSIQSIFLNILAFIGVISIFKFFIIPWLLITFEKQKSQRALFIGALIITTLMAYLADLLGISSLIGAFVDGVIIRQILLTGKHPRPWEEHALAKNLDTISFGFFVPLFFVFIGINTNVSQTESISLGIVLALFAILGTVIGSIIGVVLSRRSLKEGILIGLGVTPKGDVDLVIASLALASNIITKEFFSAIVLMAIITTFTAPFMFRYLCRKWNKELKIK